MADDNVYAVMRAPEYPKTDKPWWVVILDDTLNDNPEAHIVRRFAEAGDARAYVHQLIATRDQR